MNQLTKEEALRQIEELQRHVKSLSKNNHPAVLKEGMVFKHRKYGPCILHEHGVREHGQTTLIFLNGASWVDGRGFDGNEDEFEYVGMSKDLITFSDKPTHITPERLEKIQAEYTRFHGGHWASTKHVINLVLQGKL